MISVPDEFMTKQEDPRPNEGEVRGANIFSVDQTGTIAYIRRSNLHVERRLTLAVNYGRSPEGMMHLGAALHAVEDLFAHSNWIEIALNLLLADEKHKDLLPNLKDKDRHVFSYTINMNTGRRDDKENPIIRPVLLTGTFLGDDTLISVGGEVLTFLRIPLKPPPTEAEKKAQERLIIALLRAFEKNLKENNDFRKKLNDALVSAGLSSFLAKKALNIPFAEIYELKTKIALDIIPEPIRKKIHEIFRELLSKEMKDLADKVEGSLIKFKYTDTTLINALRIAKRNAAGKFTPTQIFLMIGIQDVSKKPIKEQMVEKIKEASNRAKALNNTPEPIIAGPSHSQISKDHANSPFFGLAFKLAATSISRIRTKLISVWDSNRGIATSPFSFDSKDWPPHNIADPDKDIRHLYHDPRQRRLDDANEIFRKGQATFNQGGESKEPYNLSTMRKNSAVAFNFAADWLLTIIGDKPSKSWTTKEILQLTQKFLYKSNPSMIDQIKTELSVASLRLILQPKGNEVKIFRFIAAELRAFATKVERSQTHNKRETFNKNLILFREQALKTFAQLPELNWVVAANIINLLDEQIFFTQVTYTEEQRRILEGYNNKTGIQHHLKELQQPAGLSTAEITLPQYVNPPFIDLLNEARIVLNHPHENNWWIPIVLEHIKKHNQQILADIEARNTGVPFFTRSGEYDVSFGHT